MEIPGYTLHKKIGKGGMATVFLATQTSFQRKVAIKVMATALQADDEFARRFMREARIVSRLNHPHIVPVYDFGEVQGNYFMVMEYVGGGLLKDRIREGISTEVAERVLREVAQALDYAGQQGFIHRDIKPDNIMFRQDGSAVLMDFGIARAADSTEQMTRMGTIVGTPRFMSPEQHRGQEIDPRADLYSLGVVFYLMLTGSTPFNADDAMAVGIKHLTEAPPPLPARHSRYQAVMDRLLAKLPEDRFQRGADIVAALDTLPEATDEDVPQPPPTSEPAGKPGRIEPMLDISERKEKAGVLSRHYIMEINVAAEDFPAFQKSFEEIAKALFEWGPKRRHKAGGVRILARVHPWIRGQVKQYIRNLSRSDSHAYLARIPVSLTMRDAQGALLEEYHLEPVETS
jgi:serine/threonine protein kinase